MYKALETTIDGYQGTYYGEVIYDQSGKGLKRDLPHGRGIWVGNDGWIWLQWFNEGKPIKYDGRYI